MNEKPILFSGPMVRAILAGSKTQTRRVVKGQPFGQELNPDEILLSFKKLPYGGVGDRLWVKETWRAAKSLDKLSPLGIGQAAVNAGYRKPWAPIQYEANGARDNWERNFDGDKTEPGKVRVSIHMPRWASRITLEIVSVRVERLQEISHRDALAEGVEYDVSKLGGDPLARFQSLWDSINDKRGFGWDKNPYVWCLEFRKL